MCLCVCLCLLHTPNSLPHTQLEPVFKGYLPLLISSMFFTMTKHYIPLNATVTTVPLKIWMGLACACPPLSRWCELR